MNICSSLIFVLPLLLLAGAIGNTLESCGLQKIKHQLKDPGTPNQAYPGQFPWQVAIYRRFARTNQTKFVCGGSLISRRFVLTADRVCTRDESVKEIGGGDGFTVLMGLHDLETINWATFRSHSVEDVFREGTGDIALLKLAVRVQFSNFVQPVCLGSAEGFFGIGGVVAGWGIQRGQELRKLRSTTMTIKKKEDCSKHAGLICAEGRNGAEICENDAGGGLLVKQNDDIWILVGVLTFSASDLKNDYCLNEGSFTDVQKYLPWIGDVTGINFVDRRAQTCGHKPGGSQSWPWHGSLHRRDQDHPSESTYWCGATIMSEQFVLTVNLISVGNLPLNQFFLKFGESERFSIQTIFPHSKKSLDLALLQIQTPLKFSPQLQPICLWQSDFSLDQIVNRTGYLVGYGSDRFDRSTELLKELPLTIASAADCTGNHERFRRLYRANQNFCAGRRKNGTAGGPDFGDTGGGLVLEDGGKWFLRGVLTRLVPTSDYDRALKTRYAIFADVTFYRNWIDGVLRKNSDL